jgi:hypothetical protein
MVGKFHNVTDHCLIRYGAFGIGQGWWKMSNNGYYGDFGSWQEEREAYERHREQQEQEPNVVPCFKCGGQMYEEENDPRLNICGECREVKVE